jgi:hypothetical protein
MDWISEHLRLARVAVALSVHNPYNAAAILCFGAKCAFVFALCAARLAFNIGRNHFLEGTARSGDVENWSLPMEALWEQGSSLRREQACLKQALDGRVLGMGRRGCTC